MFYFGNAVGETGNSAVAAQVEFADEIGVQNNPQNMAAGDNPVRSVNVKVSMPPAPAGGGTTGKRVDGSRRHRSLLC